MSDDAGIGGLIDATTKATESLEEATTALAEERNTRRLQLLAEFCVLILLLGLFFANANDSRERDEKIHRETCHAINSGRHDVREILTRTIQGGAANRTPEEQERAEAFVAEINEEVLQPLDCND
jgi:hypothetical protein